MHEPEGAHVTSTTIVSARAERMSAAIVSVSHSRFTALSRLTSHSSSLHKPHPFYGGTCPQLGTCPRPANLLTFGHIVHSAYVRFGSFALEQKSYFGANSKAGML